jgi:multiple sugar transport system permease protein
MSPGRLRATAGRLPSALIYGLVLLYALMIVVPLYYTIINSFKDNQTIFGSPLAPPSSLSLHNYSQAQQLANLTHALANSGIITGGSELVTILLAIPAAYGIARIPSRSSRVIERIFSLGFLIPPFAVLVPTFILAVDTHLLYNRVFLMLFYPAMVLPLSVLVLAQFMRTIPVELEEAAAIDGASRIGTLLRVILPLSMPGVVSVLILNFVAFWNEYLFALILTNDSSRTIQVAVPTLEDPRGTNYALLGAGIVVSLIPVYMLYTAMQGRMQRALVAGALKG